MLWWLYSLEKDYCFLQFVTIVSIWKLYGKKNQCQWTAEVRFLIFFFSENVPVGGMLPEWINPMKLLQSILPADLVWPKPGDLNYTGRITDAQNNRLSQLEEPLLSQSFRFYTGGNWSETGQRAPTRWRGQWQGLAWKEHVIESWCCSSLQLHLLGFRSALQRAKKMSPRQAQLGEGRTSSVSSHSEGLTDPSC